MSWRHGQIAILTQVLLTIAALSHLGWVAQPWVTESPKPSVCSWFSLWHPVSNWLKPFGHLVILLSNAHLFALFFRLFTQVHLLIDGSVEGQYITIIPFLFFIIPHLNIFLHVRLHPPHRHIFKIMLKDNNSKNTKRNYLNNSKRQKS